MPPTPPSDAARSEAPVRTEARRSASFGRVQVFAATVFWALSATLARFVFHDRHVDSLVVVELRLAIATAVLFSILVVRRRDLLRIRPVDVPYFLALGTFGVAAVQATYFYAIAHLGVALAILIQYLAPSLIVAFELLRGRRVGGHMILAVASALLGTALLVGGVDPLSVRATPSQWGIGFASAFAFAFYIQYSKRGLSRYHPTTVLFHTFLVAAGFWMIWRPPWEIARAGFGADLWLMFVMLGLFSTLVPFVLFSSGLRSLAPAEAGVIATAEPLLAILSASVFLGEGLRAVQLVGAGFVLLAAVVAARGGGNAD